MESKITNSANQNEELTIRKETQDANGLLAIGAGTGILGAGAALLLGAVCPLCVVLTPSLIGAGLIKHWKIKKEASKNTK